MTNPPVVFEDSGASGGPGDSGQPGSGPEAAVLGGGILGVSTAVELLRGGARVTLVTEAHPASGASGRSLSWLNSGGGFLPEYHRLRVAGMDRYRTLLARHPDLDWLRFDGGIYWDGPAATAGEPQSGVGSALAERCAAQTDQGYDARLVPAAEIPHLVPGLDPAALPPEVLFNPGEGWVSLPHLIRHLLREFALRGGILVTAAGPASVEVEAGAAAGIRTAAGLYRADVVVLAAGAGTPAVLGPLGVTLPDQSDPAMLVVTEPKAHSLKAVLNTPRVSLRPHPGSRLAMDSTWYLEQITPDDDGGWSVDPQVVLDLVDEASALLAGHPRLVPQSWRIGLKPVPGDGLPVLGELAALPGCHVAFTHSGATLGLIAGELLARKSSPAGGIPCWLRSGRSGSFRRLPGMPFPAEPALVAGQAA
ncbi:FAD-dependent oxidoreductase [Arthrobacter sp. ATA002]|uniref:NAD(P)/FAD-dependent oxidoreductase n=1 Tax=Arthrobacter sp. ATA002 TaxID=2991715 RepID=UPI0022A774EA|nr:FAD-dependent oxidoreductase [Arthrobacter sp. ATA002]WAP51400.1 FAD-dependent oxidoreductase [Arthrobacter sp. ATA002]